MRRRSQHTDTVEQRAASTRRAPTGAEERLFEAPGGGRVGVTFRRRVPLAGTFIADLYCAQLRLVVEVDGAYHADRGEADARRDRALAKLGYHVVHLSNALVLEALPNALDRLRDVVTSLRG